MLCAEATGSLRLLGSVLDWCRNPSLSLEHRPLPSHVEEVVNMLGYVRRLPCNSMEGLMSEVSHAGVPGLPLTWSSARAGAHMVTRQWTFHVE